MVNPPFFFDEIKAEARTRWESLERDADLAGPWHQLFKQVQSPRHVVSELLQNADDAGATSAAVWIEGGFFHFQHNGDDFSSDQFRSLCRFGFSNKRSLHTIGFRGIGFKSTFSLGSRVELQTPSISVYFDAKRFTEPVWSDPKSEIGATRISIRIEKKERLHELQKSLQRWEKSPFSLLFFKSIRELNVASKRLIWISKGAGPCANSEWMSLDGSRESFLLVQSPPEPFPGESIGEIKDERLLPFEESFDLPPCSVEIVVGAPGTLNVVLPTGVDVNLPFAINGPFVQDPARLKIKEPDISPTNRWLLARAGRLAGKALLATLGNENLAIEHRARAYDLMPNVDRDDDSLSGTCSASVEIAFNDIVENELVLLTETGALSKIGGAIVLPDGLEGIWDDKVIADLFDEEKRPVLSSVISESNRKKLVEWDWVKELYDYEIRDRLKHSPVPKPKTWSQLFRLWFFSFGWINSYWAKDSDEFRLVPINGSDELFASAEVVRIGERRTLGSKDDWTFLSSYLRVMNPAWTQFLAEKRRATKGDRELEEAVETVYSILETLELSKTSDVDNIFDSIARTFFSEQTNLSDCVRLAQIGAFLNVNVGDGMWFALQNLTLVQDDVISDPDGSLLEMLPTSFRPRLLHSDYYQFTSCSKDQWNEWVESSRANLHGFVRPERIVKRFWTRKDLIDEVARRGGRPETLRYQYVTNDFVIEDFDFPQEYWTFWKEQSENNPQIWMALVKRIVSQSTSFWSEVLNAKANQVATTGSKAPVTNDGLRSAWVLKFAELACLPDVNGNPRRPVDLMLRNEYTEPFMGIEYFLDRQLDTKEMQKLWLALGVRTRPDGPDQILDRIRALAKAESPPHQELEKWYRRLDEVMQNASTADAAAIQIAFREENIIFTDNDNWTNAAGVFLLSDEVEGLGVDLIPDAVRGLALWGRVGVAERPNRTYVFEWIRSLADSQKLSKHDVQRINRIAARYPIELWNECGLWLNLDGELVEAASLTFKLEDNYGDKWNALLRWVKQGTADLSSLREEDRKLSQFAHLASLFDEIEYNAADPLTREGGPFQCEWAEEVGNLLTRIVIEDTNEMNRVRSLGRRLASTKWQFASNLKIEPFISNEPVGPPIRVEVFWSDNQFFLKRMSPATGIKKIVQEISSNFGSEYSELFRTCFERTPEFIREFIGSEFELDITPNPQVSNADDTNHENPNPVQSPKTSAKDDLGDSVPEDASPANDEGADSGHVLTDDDLEDDDSEFDESDDDDDWSDEEDEDETDFEGVGRATRPRRKSRKEGKPDLIHRFAAINGFKVDYNGQFEHDDGRRITKTRDLGYFDWQLVGRDGHIDRYYFVAEHCLKLRPLELPFEVWRMLTDYTELYAMILTEPDESPIEITGSAIVLMHDTRVISLNPASYRISYQA